MILFPVIPEITLAIPLKSNPSDKKIITIPANNSGYAKSMLAKATAIPPNTIPETREPLSTPLEMIPEPIKPNP